MQKTALVTIILLTFFTGNLLAKTIGNEALHSDTSAAVKQAQRDAHKFKLDKADLQIFRQNRQNSTSDFFKPTTATTSNPALLQDSAYVKAYRAEAYHRTLDRRSTGHRILFDGLIVAEVAVGLFIFFHYAIHS
jgi:hypothetical protein